jgi:hypothetical protein
MQRLAADVRGDRSGAAAWRGATPAQDQGLAVSLSMVDDDGTRSTLEVVTLNRDPLPPAMFQLPADYKESSRPLTASEHPHVDARPADGGRGNGERRITGLIIGVMAIVILIGLSIHAFILHLAASVVLDRARFRQALLASAIMWVVLVAVELMRLPSIVSTGFGAFTTFAALKIAYGASVPRTLALFFVSIVIAVGAAFVVHGLLPA